MLVTGRDIDTTINHLASRHHGAVATWLLREAGIDRHAERRRVRSGRMRPYIPGTYLVGPAAIEPGRASRVAAAVLAGGPGARLGGEELAHRLGAWNRPSGMIDVITTIHPWCLGADDIRFLRLRRDDPYVGAQVVDRIAAIGVERMLGMLGTTLDPYQLAYVLDELACAGLLDRASIEEELCRRARRRGMATFRAAWALYQGGCTGTRNASEDRVLPYMLDMGPVLVNVRNATGIAGVIPDFYFVDRGRIVEFDGSWAHDRPHARAADAARDALHLADGIPTLRIPTLRIWRDLSGVVRDVRAFLAG